MSLGMTVTIQICCHTHLDMGTGYHIAYNNRLNILYRLCC